MEQKKIFLVFSDTGGGHRTAANAIKNALEELWEKKGGGGDELEIIMRDLIAESNQVNLLIEKLYNRLLKDRQDLMKYYFHLIEWIKPNENALSYKMTSSFAKRVISDMNPAVIVSVHPMVNHFIARTLKELGLEQRIKLITVLTDPNSNLWTGWACPDADLTIAPNDLAKDRLICFGLDPARIKVLGMPILPEFIKPPIESREVLLERLGLDPNMLTVALTAGSAGGGNMLKIYKAMKEVKRPFQIIISCGKNKKLMAKVEAELQQFPWKTVVIPYMTRVADDMNAVDLLVTKAGGLTTFEAIARRLPMALDMITEPMPQEAGTAEILIEAGLAKAVRAPQDIVPIINQLNVVENRLEQPLPSVHCLDRVDAVYEIAEVILNYITPKTPAA